MIIESLKLKDYRNINKVEINFDESINIIYGLNGQGKTNLVESIDFLSSLKSFRGDQVESLIKVDSDFSLIDAYFNETSIKHQVRLVLSNKGVKITFDKQELKKNSDFIGIFNVITFSPSDVTIFKDSPKRRREFLDDEISKMSPSYYHLLLEYRKVLKERNELLKQDNFDKIFLDVLTKRISQLNLEILKRRYDFIDKLNEILKDKFKEVSKIEKDVVIEYESFVNKDEVNNETIYQKLKDKYEEDLKYKSTQLGIHRDDLLFKIDDKPLSVFASQGQMRLCIIATKLALLDLSYKSTGSRAIVVFDDVLSELDETRQTQILEKVPKDNQIFITCAQSKEQIKRLLKKGKMFKMTDGQLETEE